MTVNSKVQLSNSLYRVVVCKIAVKWLSGKCQTIILKRGQNRFKYWLGTGRRQAWANVDSYLCRHMASLGHNGWNTFSRMKIMGLLSTIHILWNDFFLNFNNKSAFIQVNASHQVGDKPLAEPNMPQFIETCKLQWNINRNWYIFI